MKEAVAAILSLQLQVYLYQVVFSCKPHTAAEPTEEIPYVDKASSVHGSSRPETTDRKLTRKLVTTSLTSR